MKFAIDLGISPLPKTVQGDFKIKSVAPETLGRTRETTSIIFFMLSEANPVSTFLGGREVKRTQSVALGLG